MDLIESHSLSAGSKETHKRKDESKNGGGSILSARLIDTGRVMSRRDGDKERP